VAVPAVVATPGNSGFPGMLPPVDRDALEQQTAAAGKLFKTQTTATPQET
jgi:hypothetical protein